MEKINKTLRAVGKLDGWLSAKEAAFLYTAAKKTSGNIVEIGSWKGKSTVCLALGLKGKKKCKVYAIDHHQGLTGIGDVKTFGEFKKNVKRFGVSGCVVPMVMKSEEAAKIWLESERPINFLWI